VNWRLLQILGLAILGTATALAVNEGVHRGLYESFSIIATIVSLGLAIVAHFREK